MTDLSIAIVGAEPDRYAASPTMAFKLRLTESSGARVHAVALRCQIRIEPQKRRYNPAEEEALLETFGETPQWGNSLKPFLWLHTSTVLGGFDGSLDMDLPVMCSYDFEVAAAKYLHALNEGEIPLIALFNGTVFSAGPEGLAVEPVAWHKEALFRLPVATWRQMMDLYFPNSGWIRLRRDTLDAIQRYKAEQALPTWEQALERLLKQAGEAGL